ncbi:hypothetical protein TrRE_jg3694 [Triparma retinervis]|uniref:Selenoprotein O n=1 Tax=Triparma retinervis TaxID=2557542 RepID=A0A9W7A5P5_9STRA|nr:hypothetical protein TrRE_jg3694 [Triparma retinervis]
MVNNLISECDGDSYIGNIAKGARTVTNCHYVNIPSPSPPVSNPYLVAVSPSSAALLSLNPTELPLDTLSGDVEGVATVYGCHCGTQYFGQLGDGRAVTIADHEGFEVQLKGSTTTPFSRGFDGAAALRGCIREMLGCEGLSGLLVPVTRVLSVVGTGEFIQRPWYGERDGRSKRKYPPRHMIRERGAVLTRFAKSFLRMGHFEIHYLREEEEELEVLVKHGMEVLEIGDGDWADRVSMFVRDVSRRQAELMCSWMRVGYCQGNMNSDNTSIIGATLDLGPFSFMDAYERGFQPFTSDGSGRFSFCNQPSAGLTATRVWAECVVGVVEGEERRREIVDAAEGTFREVFKEGWEDVRRRKLGFGAYDEGVGELWREAEELMEGTAFGVDYTVFFSRLVNVGAGGGGAEEGWEVLKEAFYALDEAEGGVIEREVEWKGWVRRYLEASKGEEEGGRIDIMTRANPLVVPRNWIMYECYKKAEGGVVVDGEEVGGEGGDFRPIEELLEVLQNPYQVHKGVDERIYGRTPKEYVGKPGLAFLS